MRIRLLLFTLTLLIGASCRQGAVVFAPTAAPPDISPLRFEHPSGAFSLMVPRIWSVSVQETPTLAAVHFTPLAASNPLLSISAVVLDEPGDLLSLVNRYQETRTDANRYSEQDRQAMGDGSWRLSGVRSITSGRSEQVNTFIELSGETLVISEITIPADHNQQIELEIAINTLRINPDSHLEPAPLRELAFTRATVLEIADITAWTAEDGVWFITGEAANRSQTTTFTEVPVRVDLLSAEGQIVAEARDTVMGYGIPPGGYAPFSFRFGRGQPPEAVRYVLSVGSDEHEITADETSVLLGTESLSWSDESTITEEGHLLVTGTLRNISNADALNPLATVTVFGASRQAIGAWFAPVLEGTLSPGESIPFEIRIPVMGGIPVDYIVNIQALPNS